MGLKYVVVVVFNASPFVSGNNMIGNNAVTGIGMASVIHHMEIQTVEASTPCAAVVIPSISRCMIRKKASGPASKAIGLLYFFISATY